MDRYCGILRNQDGLTAGADDQLALLEQEISGIAIHDRFTLETCQMVTAARAIVHAALLRKNSIGAHFRTDDPTGSLNRA